MIIQHVAFLIVLSLLGIVDSIYIAWKNAKKQPLACPLNTDCNAVLNSKWNKTFGIKNEFLGIVYYLTILILAIILIYTGIVYVYYALLIISAGALLYSGFLVYLQKYVIKEYCFYCLISSLITLLIFINVVIL